MHGRQACADTRMQAATPSLQTEWCLEQAQIMTALRRMDCMPRGWQDVP